MEKTEVVTITKEQLTEVINKCRYQLEGEGFIKKIVIIGPNEIEIIIKT